MKRKVIKQGNNTLTITLPRKWTSEFKIKPGDEIDLKDAENGLLLTTHYHEEPKSIDLNVDDMARLSLAKLLTACFEQGFDTIRLNFSKRTTESWSHGQENVADVINFFVGRLVGFEVLSQSPKCITIGNLSEKLTKFDNILSRVFFLIEEYLQHLVGSIKSGSYSDLGTGENMHDNITKLVALASRMVYENSSLPRAEALNYFAVLNYLDKITDHIRYAYRNTMSFKKKAGKETLELAEKAFRYLELYRHFFYKFSYNAINELDVLRGEIKKMFIEASKKNRESSIAANFDAIAETLHGAIQPRIAVELSKGAKK